MVTLKIITFLTELYDGSSCDRQWKDYSDGEIVPFLPFDFLLYLRWEKKVGKSLKNTIMGTYFTPHL